MQTTRPLKLLFLDFDGVLHPCTAGTFIYLDRFQDFLRKHPDLGVVLSTSWRLDYPWEELLGFFAPDLRARLLGATPELPDGPAVREKEIHAWLSANQCGHLLWAALDDDASLFSPGCPNLVQCETIRGLRPAQLTLIEETLRLA